MCVLVIDDSALLPPPQHLPPGAWIDSSLHRRPHEDSHTSFETSLVVARVLRSALFLGFSFAFVVVGSSGLAKLTIDVLLLLAILNLLILREEFVKYLPEIKRVLSILAALLVVVASVLYVLVG